MRNLIIIMIGILLYACDPNYDTTYYLMNSTNDSIKVEFYRNGSVDNEKTILPNSSIILLHDSGLTGSPTKISFELDDSIRVTKNNKYITYYRDSTLKSEIYNIENWIEKKVGKHRYEYTYIIDNELFE